MSKAAAVGTHGVRSVVRLVVMLVFDNNEFPELFLLAVNSFGAKGTTTLDRRPLLTAAIGLVRRRIAMAYTNEVVTNEMIVVTLVRPENTKGKDLGHSHRLEVIEDVIPRFVILTNE